MALNQLVAWLERPGVYPTSLIETVAESDADMSWILPAIQSNGQALMMQLEEAARNPDAASIFKGSVPRWLDVIGSSGQPFDVADEFRLLACSTLLNSGYKKDARLVLALVSQDVIRSASLDAAQNGDYLLSLLMFEYLQMDEHVNMVRNAAFKSVIERALRNYDLQDLESALKDCTAAIDLMPKSRAALELRAVLYYDMSMIGNAVRDYERLVEISHGDDKVRTLRRKADLLWESRQSPRRLIGCYDEILRLKPDDMLTLQDKVAMQARATGDLRAGLREAQGIISRFPYRAEGYLESGTIYRLLNEFSKALETVDAGISMVMDDELLVALRGIILVDIGRVDEAVNYLLEQTAKHPRSEPIYSSLGRAYMLGVGPPHGPQGAIEWYKQALGANPDEVGNYLALGMSLFDIYAGPAQAGDALTLCIDVLTEGIKRTGLGYQLELQSAMHGLRGTIYNERGLEGDRELGDADFREIKRLWAGSARPADHGMPERAAKVLSVQLSKSERMRELAVETIVR